MPDKADSTELLVIPETGDLPVTSQLLQGFQMVLIDRLPRHSRIRSELLREALVSISPLLSKFAPAFCSHIRRRESDTGRERCSSRIECDMSLGLQLTNNGGAPVNASTEDIEEQSTRRRRKWHVYTGDGSWGRFG